jgi:hypothetical protein
VFDRRGDIVAWSGSSDGTHHHDTRYLSRIEHRLNSAPSLLLSSNVEEDNAVLTVDLANPGVVSRGLCGELVHVKLGNFCGRRPNQERCRGHQRPASSFFAFQLS